MTPLSEWFEHCVPQKDANPANSANRPFGNSNFSEISRGIFLELEKSEAYAERVAIMEYESGFPKDWAEAYARVCLMPIPTIFQREDWQCMIDRLGMLLDAHLPDLVRYNWNVSDIFNVDEALLSSDSTNKGLIPLLLEHEVLVVIDKRQLGIRNTHTDSKHFFIKPSYTRSESKPIWETQHYR